MILCLLNDNKWNIIFLCIDNGIKSTAMCLTHAKFCNHTISCLNRKGLQEKVQPGNNSDNKIQSFVAHLTKLYDTIIDIFLFYFCCVDSDAVACSNDVSIGFVADHSKSSI